MSAIIVKDLVKRYGRFTAVQDVSFEVASGQVTALLGPNGAGKTTTIEILEGFLAPTAGTVQVLGVNPRTGGPALAGPDRAGPADHQPGRPAHGRRGADDVRGTVPEAAPDRGGPRPHRPGLGRQDQDRGAERGPASPGRPGPGHHRPAGDAVPGRADHRPGPGSTPRLWSVIENLTAAGTTVLLTTHYLDEAQYLAHRVIVLADGRVVADASPDELRAMGGVPVISFRLPSPAPALPAALAQHVGQQRAHDAVRRRDR